MTVPLSIYIHEGKLTTEEITNTFTTNTGTPSTGAIAPAHPIITDGGENDNPQTRRQVYAAMRLSGLGAVLLCRIARRILKEIEFCQLCGRIEAETGDDLMTISAMTTTLQSFQQHLLHEEREEGTIEKYLRDAGRFLGWISGEYPTDSAGWKEKAIQWKEHLCGEKYSPTTINSMLAAVNKLLAFLGFPEIRVKYLRVQRKLFRQSEKELTKEEYLRLIEAAQSLGRERLALLMEAICATGIRVSEVRYLTVEAAWAGRAEISLKGKIRTILLPGKLCRKLLKYAKKNKIASGEIFLTRGGNGLSRRQIWSEMKAICKKAGVAESKVFPHNLRHLFARTFYKVCQDVARLADVLGHSSIETTRIYLVSTGVEHARQLEKLKLIC